MEKHFNKLSNPWTLTDTYIERIERRGFLKKKKKMTYEQIISLSVSTDPVYECDKVCYLSVAASEEEKFVCFKLGLPLDDEGEEALKYLLSKCSKIRTWEKEKIISDAQKKRHELELILSGFKPDLNKYLDSQLKKAPKEQKDASVVGRAIVGGIIAGPAGAIVGAVSAADKNNRNKK